MAAPAHGSKAQVVYVERKPPKSSVFADWFLVGVYRFHKRALESAERCTSTGSWAEEREEEARGRASMMRTRMLGRLGNGVDVFVSMSAGRVMGCPNYGSAFFLLNFALNGENAGRIDGRLGRPDADGLYRAHALERVVKLDAGHGIGQVAICRKGIFILTEKRRGTPERNNGAGEAGYALETLALGDYAQIEDAVRMRTGGRVQLVRHG